MHCSAKHLHLFFIFSAMLAVLHACEQWQGKGGSGRLRHLSLPRDCVHHQPQLKLLLRPRQLKLLLLFISKVNFVLYHTSNNNSSTTREGWGDGGGRTVKSARHRMGNETFQRKRKLYTLRPGNFRCAVRRVNKVKQMEKQPQPAASSHCVPRPLRPSPDGFSLATIALRQTIFLLSSAIHAGVKRQTRVKTRGWRGGKGRGRVYGILYSGVSARHFYCWRSEVFDAQLLALLLKELKA